MWLWLTTGDITDLVVYPLVEATSIKGMSITHTMSRINSTFCSKHNVKNQIDSIKKLCSKIHVIIHTQLIPNCFSYNMSSGEPLILPKSVLNCLCIHCVFPAQGFRIIVVSSSDNKRPSAAVWPYHSDRLQ